MKIMRPPANKDSLKEAIEIIFDYGSGKLGEKEIGFIGRCMDEHLHYEDVHYRNKTSLPSEKIWATVKFLRFIESKKIAIGKREFFYSTTSWISRKLHFFDLDLGGSPAGSVPKIPEENKEKFLLRSIMEEAISSSQLEGASTTRKAAKKILRSGRRPKDKGSMMIVNNYRAMQKIRDFRDSPLTKEIILELHSLISQDTLSDKKYEGKFRDNNGVKVAGLVDETVYHPPDHAEVERLVEGLCKFYNDDKTFVHPIVKGVIVHFLIGWIHPFVDGNGRLARTLFFLCMMKSGYRLFEFLSISRIIINSPAQYARAYLKTETDENDLTYFIIYNLEKIEKALKDLKEYVNRKLSEEESVKKYLTKKFVTDENQAKVLYLFDLKPSYGVKEMSEQLNVTKSTAQKNLAYLAEKGLLIQKKMKNKFIFIKRSR